MERLVFDILCELFEIDRGNCYIFVVVDYFMKWMEVFVLLNMEVEIIVCIIME